MSVDLSRVRYDTELISMFSSWEFCHFNIFAENDTMNLGRRTILLPKVWNIKPWRHIIGEGKNSIYIYNLKGQ